MTSAKRRAMRGQGRTRQHRRQRGQTSGISDGLGPWMGLVAALGGVACSGETVTLGRSDGTLSVWSEPELVAELTSDAVDDNPTLTEDLLEIYFTSRRDGGSGSTDLWFARRASRDAPFDPPEPLVELNTDAFESSPAISRDGLTLWFGSEREGGLGDVDVWVSTRADRDAPWSAPTHVASLSSEAADIPRPLGAGDRVMPLASRRNDAGLYWTYLAERDETGAFGAPVLVEELAADDAATVDAFLTDDGLHLWFNRTPVDGSGDLYVSTRETLDAPFGEPVPVEDVNTPFEERDPWLSPDGDELYFASDRNGKLQIFRAVRRTSDR